MIVGDPLPTLRGEFLTGRTALLPQAAGGRVALLLLGFSYDSRFAVEAWAGKFREQFHRDPRVTFYEITVYGGANPWKQRLGFRDPKAAYLILLDASGRVAWRYTGGLDEQAYHALSSEVLRLLPGK
jgi:hypothetical protein